MPVDHNVKGHVLLLPKRVQIYKNLFSKLPELHWCGVFVPDNREFFDVINVACSFLERFFSRLRYLDTKRKRVWWHLITQVSVWTHIDDITDGYHGNQCPWKKIVLPWKVNAELWTDLHKWPSCQFWLTLVDFSRVLLNWFRDRFESVVFFIINNYGTSQNRYLDSYLNRKTLGFILPIWRSCKRIL